MMANEKPGGHGERSVAVGVLDMALWDLRRQGRGRSRCGGCSPTATAAARPIRTPGSMPPAAITIPARTSPPCRTRCGITATSAMPCVKIKIGGVPLDRGSAAHRGGAGGRRQRRQPRGRRQRPLRPRRGDRLCRRARALRPALVRGAARPARLPAHAVLAERYAPPLATGENLFSMQDARNLIRHGGLRPDRDVLQFDPRPVLRPRRIPAHPRHAGASRLVAAALRAAWRPPVRAQHRGRARASAATNSYPDVFAPFGGFADDCPVENSLVRLPDIPGIGFEAKAALYRVMRRAGAEG